MSVADYTRVGKSNVDEVIEHALEAEHIVSAPIEHYSTNELIDLSEKARKNDLVVTIHAEHSNFYQGVLIHVIKRKNIDETFVKYI